MADAPPKVVQEHVLDWVGVSLLVLEDGSTSVEVPGLKGHEHDDFDWSYLERGEDLAQCQNRRLWHQWMTTASKIET